MGERQKRKPLPGIGQKRDSDYVTALWSDEAGEADRDFFSLSLYFCVCSAVYGVNDVFF